MDALALWSETLRSLETDLTPHSYATWFKPVEPVAMSDSQLTLSVPNQFHADWLANHFRPVIREAVAARVGHPVEVRFVVAASAPSGDLVPEPATPAPEPAAEGVQPASSTNGSRRPRSTLNPRYSFGNFVVGHGNQFSHAACLNVANKPGGSYNPLVISGGVGLGKTHLLHAVGHHVLASSAEARVACVSSEQFMNEFINSLSTNRIDAFRNKWRQDCDVLLIDDIQFIAGKDRTQEEFFHTFNSLYGMQKQIVLTCDKMPKDIPGLQERLLTRFNWGLIADIKAPDFETRVAIVRKKAKIDGVDIGDDVAYMLAQKITTNVRELEGALTRLHAYSSFSGEAISPDFTRRVLADIFTDRKHQVSIESVQRAVAEFFNVKVADLKSRRRHQGIVVPRQVAMYLCRQLTSASYPDIGARFGGKDHSTVISAVRKIGRLIDDDPALRANVEAIQQVLAG